MAGGRGERFWPASQPAFPKQFLTVFNNVPLINQTINRIKPSFRKNARALIIPKELKRLTLIHVGKEQTIIEPMRRNTAPAICLAAMVLHKKHGDGIVHIMPADHLITPQKSFRAALRYAEYYAVRGYLVTYGIQPDRPETGYGYIKIGKKLGARGKIRAFCGEGFTEKPSLRTARRYLRTRRYLWNSGIFTFRIEHILDELRSCAPDVYKGVAQYVKTGNKKYFRRVPSISIDYAVMEKSSNICVIKGSFAWDDVGSWRALERYFRQDKRGNIFLGDVRTLETEDSILYTHGLPLKAYGVKGLIVVVSPHGVLVCHKEKAPYLKNLLT